MALVGDTTHPFVETSKNICLGNFPFYQMLMASNIDIIAQETKGFVKAIKV